MQRCRAEEAVVWAVAWDVLAWPSRPVVQSSTEAGHDFRRTLTRGVQCFPVLPRQCPSALDLTSSPAHLQLFACTNSTTQARCSCTATLPLWTPSGMFSRINQLVRHLSRPLPNYAHLSAASPRASSISSSIMAAAATTPQTQGKGLIHTAACLIIGDEVLGGKVRIDLFCSMSGRVPQLSPPLLRQSTRTPRTWPSSVSP